MNRNITELFQSSLETVTGTHLYKEFLDSCLEHGAFHSMENAETIIKHINTSLNNSIDREKGLLLLLAFLPQISVEVFSNNAVSWMLHCTKLIFQKGGIIDSLVVKALTEQIKLSVKFPEVNKETAKQIVPKFLLDCVKRKSNVQVSVELLECLHVCMSEYPGPSGEFKMEILRLLLSTVEYSPALVGVAAKCLPLIARVGGGGKQGLLHKTSWQQQQLSLVVLLHSLLNNIYEHVDCLMDSELMPQVDHQLSLEPINEKNILRKTQRTARQFASVAQFLQAMLLGKFPVAKSVAPNAILDVIAHAQKPTHVSLSSSTEALAVILVLPSIQVAALQLLESLILCLGRNVVPLAGQVSYLCSQVIIWSQRQHSSWPYGMDKPFSRTRLAGYCCLHSLLTVVGSATHLNLMEDKLLPILLSDIHHEKSTIKLRVGSKIQKGKKKQQLLVSQEDRSEKLGNNVANRKLCERAVLLLALVVRTSASSLKPDSFRNILETVLILAREMPVPYSDANCHSALYQLLLALCLHSHPLIAPPVAPAITICTSGLHHPNPKIKTTCASVLSSLDKIIRPVAATLYFPLPNEKLKPLAREDSDNEEESVGQVSKKRRITSADDLGSIVTIGSDNSNNESSVVSLINGSRDVKMDMEESDSSVAIVEVSPVIRKSDNYKEEQKAINSEKNVIEDESNHSVEAENCRTELSEKENIETLPYNGKEVTVTVPEIMSEQDKLPKEVQTILHNILPEPNNVDLKNDLFESKNADVSEMLMDFNDEVCSGNES